MITIRLHEWDNVNKVFVAQNFEAETFQVSKRLLQQNCGTTLKENNLEILTLSIDRIDYYDSQNISIFVDNTEGN